ncbi:hypothetical protein [Nocardia miyunensis]|uniref:hypothetical protein n=1 Tax=Nocardia miyunensis TaxID=282684 RepID=UPI00082A6ED2|nr:hypothetical protein [Nocardia miyunensis]
MTVTESDIDWQTCDLGQIHVFSRRFTPLMIDDVRHIDREQIGAGPAGTGYFAVSQVRDVLIFLADNRIHVVQPNMATSREVGNVVGVTREVFDPRADDLEIE